MPCRLTRPTVVERRLGPGVDARIIRVEAEADLREIGARDLEQLEAQLRAEPGGHPQGDEVGELGERALAEDDGAGPAELAGDEGVLARTRSAERDGSGGGGHVARGDVVLEDDRNSEQRGPAVAFAVPVAGVPELVIQPARVLD